MYMEGTSACVKVNLWRRGFWRPLDHPIARRLHNTRRHPLPPRRLPGHGPPSLRTCGSLAPPFLEASKPSFLFRMDDVDCLHGETRECVCAPDRATQRARIARVHASYTHFTA